MKDTYYTQVYCAIEDVNHNINTGMKYCVAVSRQGSQIWLKKLFVAWLCPREQAVGQAAIEAIAT